MKKIQYLVRIRRDAHSDWGASVPNLRGCVATGKTLDSALRCTSGLARGRPAGAASEPSDRHAAPAIPRD